MVTVHLAVEANNRPGKLCLNIKSKTAPLDAVDTLGGEEV
jgi:hypothetical protein